MGWISDFLGIQDDEEVATTRGLDPDAEQITVDQETIDEVNANRRARERGEDAPQLGRGHTTAFDVSHVPVLGDAVQAVQEVRRGERELERQLSEVSPVVGEIARGARIISSPSNVLGMGEGIARSVADVGSRLYRENVERDDVPAVMSMPDAMIRDQSTRHDPEAVDLDPNAGVLAAGALEGASMGTAPLAAGALEAAFGEENPLDPDDSVSEAYARGRDQYRQSRSEAASMSPEMFRRGQEGGSAAMQLGAMGLLPGTSAPTRGGSMFMEPSGSRVRDFTQSLATDVAASLPGAEADIITSEGEFNPAGAIEMLAETGMQALPGAVIATNRGQQGRQAARAAHTAASLDEMIPGAALRLNPEELGSLFEMGDWDSTQLGAMMRERGITDRPSGLRVIDQMRQQGLLDATEMVPGEVVGTAPRPSARRGQEPRVAGREVRAPAREVGPEPAPVRRRGLFHGDAPEVQAPPTGAERDMLIRLEHILNSAQPATPIFDAARASRQAQARGFRAGPGVDMVSWGGREARFEGWNALKELVRRSGTLNRARYGRARRQAGLEPGDTGFYTDVDVEAGTMPEGALPGDYRGPSRRITTNVDSPGTAPGGARVPSLGERDQFRAIPQASAMRERPVDLIEERETVVEEEPSVREAPATIEEMSLEELRQLRGSRDRVSPPEPTIESMSLEELYELRRQRRGE